MTEKKRMLAIIEKMDEMYPDANCSLVYSDPWQLLVCAILATQCTDKRVNQVTPKLFEIYPTIDAFAAADQEKLEDDIRPTGFYRIKATHLILTAQRIIDVYDRKIPDTIEELLTLPGVGRKIANLIIGDIYGKPSLVIDTHAARVFKRWGFARNTNPLITEKEMRPLIPPERSTKFCHQIVDHGRALCSARMPECQHCGLSSLCKKNFSW